MNHKSVDMKNKTWEWLSTVHCPLFSSLVLLKRLLSTRHIKLVSLSFLRCVLKHICGRLVVGNHRG